MNVSGSVNFTFTEMYLIRSVGKAEKSEYYVHHIRSSASKK
jgi:hypothetical protein